MRTAGTELKGTLHFRSYLTHPRLTKDGRHAEKGHSNIKTTNNEKIHSGTHRDLRTGFLRDRGNHH